MYNWNEDEDLRRELERADDHFYVACVAISYVLLLVALVLIAVNYNNFWGWLFGGAP